MDAASQLRAGVEESARRFEHAFEHGQMEIIGAMYAPDAVLMEPHYPPIRGLEGVTAFWAGAKQMGAKRLGLEVTDVENSGDLLAEQGNYTLTVEAPGQPAVTDQGKYLLLWKRQPGGDWKIYRHISNTSLPVQAPRVGAV
jgi:ketosteroid isomerase-like protein